MTCECDHCLEGVTIPDGTECCKSHTTWSVTNPWLTCAETELLLHYAGGDTWITDEFDGPEGDPNTYRFILTIDVDGVLAGVPNYTYLTLVVEDDNGGDPVCLRYGRVGFDCQCDNALTRKKPYGKVHGIELGDTSCNVCLKPENLVACDQAGCEWIEVVKVELPAGVWSEGCDPDVCNIEGEHWLPLFDPQETGQSCSWRKIIDGGTGGCGGIGTSQATITFYVDTLRNRLVVEVLTSDTGSDGYTQHQWTLDDFDGCDGVATTATLTYLGSLGSVGDSGCIVADPTATEVIVHLPGAPVTDSGACEDEDCAAGVPPTNPGGACCFGGFCLDFVDEALCAEFGGGWHTEMDDCQETCNPSGACCVSGGCFNGTSEVCALVGGTFMAGADCEDDPCEEGACCRADGTCEVVPEGDCQGAGEHFYGPGTDCVGKACLGACCCDDTPCCPGESFTASECLSGPVGEPPCGGAGWTFHIDDDCASCVGSGSC